MRNMKIKVINGPNLNMLGIREKEVYGRQSYADLVEYVTAEAEKLGAELEFFQSNHEGELIDAVQAAYENFDAIIINPAAYTHTSIALLDALLAVGLPAVEVHISDVASREGFRQISYVHHACMTTFRGMGFDGYVEAVKYLIENV